MGNRTSSTQQQHPSAPPPLLSAAVTGDAVAFAKVWEAMKNDSNDPICIKDRQDNNVLHALFSCRSGKPDEILRFIHTSVMDTAGQLLVPLYSAVNQLGCTPLWILIAYGNVELLKLVMELTASDDALRQVLPALVVQPNHQGDTPLLATCSQGNTAMVRYLMKCSSNSKSGSGALEDGNAPAWLLSDNKDGSNSMQALLTQGNQKGTAPLQIVVANGHLELLQYLLTDDECPLPADQIWRGNAAGLSLFHICSERNFDAGLQALLNFVLTPDDDGSLDKVVSLKDRNGANPLHVACFCGNVQAVKVWVDVITTHTKTTSKDDSSSAVALLDRTDGQGRTAYWIACVQGHQESIGQTLLAPVGVQTTQPAQMVQEIAQAQERRTQRRAQQPAIDGNALLGR